VGAPLAFIAAGSRPLDVQEPVNGLTVPALRGDILRGLATVLEVLLGPLPLLPLALRIGRLARRTAASRRREPPPFIALVLRLVELRVYVGLCGVANGTPDHAPDRRAVGTRGEVPPALDAAELAAVHLVVLAPSNRRRGHLGRERARLHEAQRLAGRILVVRHLRGRLVQRGTERLLCPVRPRPGSHAVRC